MGMSDTTEIDVAPERPSRAAALARRWPVLVCAAFAMLAAFETARSLLAPRAVPRDVDWEAAAAEVRAAFQPGDLVVFAPAWADPVGRFHLGDLVPVEMAARADASHYGRIWEVAIRGAHAPDARQGTPVSSTKHGLVTVSLYTKAPPVKTVFDFTGQLTRARVTQLPSNGKGDERTCYLSGGAFRCTSTEIAPRVL